MKLLGIVFGSILTMLGLLIFAGSTIDPIASALTMRSWISDKASLVEVKVHEYESAQTSYDTNYKVKIKYTYVVDGIEYVGDRVSIVNEKTNVYQDHNMVVGNIISENINNNGISIWYDSEHPNRSIYDKSLDWRQHILRGLFDSLLFVLGLFVVYMSVRKNKNKKLKRKRHKKPSTKTGVFYSDILIKKKKSWLVFLANIIVFGLLSSTLMGYDLVKNIGSITLLLIPILYLKRAYLLQVDWSKYKSSPIKLTPNYGVIGGDVVGKLLLEGDAKKISELCLKLVATRYYSEISYDGSKSRKTEMFSSQIIAPCKHNSKSSVVKFKFSVPADLMPTSKVGSDYCRWTIRVKSVQKEIKFNREYEIPVEITEESRSVEEELNWPLSDVEIDRMNDRLGVVSSKEMISFHTKGSQLGKLCFYMGMLLMVLGMFVGVMVDIVPGISLFIFSTPFVMMGGWMMGKNCKIQFSKNRCKVEQYLFSKKLNEREIEPKEIRSIKYYMSSNLGGGEYSIKLCIGKESPMNIGGNMISERNAMHMKKEILSFIGLDVA